MLITQDNAHTRRSVGVESGVRQRWEQVCGQKESITSPAATPFTLTAPTLQSGIRMLPKRITYVLHNCICSMPPRLLGPQAPRTLLTSNPDTNPLVPTHVHLFQDCSNITLVPGDRLYLPFGVLHRAITNAGGSAHMTMEFMKNVSCFSPLTLSGYFPGRTKLNQLEMMTQSDLGIQCWFIRRLFQQWYQPVYIIQYHAVLSRLMMDCSHCHVPCTNHFALDKLRGLHGPI